ncbi:TerB family tellurite resistance protein [bacterium]|nr:TerB family tellurite resistance protein [bacterium]
MACQEQFRRLFHGEVPMELWLPGRIAVSSFQKGQSVLVDDTLKGETPVEFSDLCLGQHRVNWVGGPMKKVILDEGESIRVTWKGAAEEVEIEGFIPEPNWWCIGFHEDEPVSVSSRELLGPYIVPQIHDLPVESSLEAILKGVRKPVSPFSNEGRLTVDVVFKILLEEIVADGVLDEAEKEVLRAIRERLLIPDETYDSLYQEALEKARLTRPSGRPLNARMLYIQLYERALEDGVLELSEKELLSSVAEALLLDPDDIKKAIEKNN